ncbi:MAG: DUF1553 domain-containing protein, partial [Pedosphaera parvula]|nr:DUF1553 domain-containing protein [Pedosphaera parvula]
EQDVDPAKTDDGGLKFAARPELDADSTISLFDAGQGAVLYQRLTSTVAQPRTIQLAANGPFRVWLNGTVIYESNEVRRVRGNADVVPVQFNAGDNHLVVKLVNTESRRTALVNLGPLAAPRAIVAAAEKTAADRTAEDTATLESYFKATGAPFTELRAQQAAINEERKSLLATMATVPVLSELPAAQQRQTHIHVRGSFLSPGDAVTAGVPAAFHPFPADAPRNRLGLAQWLVSMDNPLTARVAVNRHWEKFWGTGIVETSEDFGIQGSPPVNQALLDWMAVEFMQHGWSMKELCRMIVTSAAYRQSAAVTPALREVDPYNRLFSRGPRFRLEAEAVRDQALAASGLLSTKMHGPSVMPAQPEGVWQVVYSGAAWETPANEDRHRRGIYTYWRRTSPYPSMVTFDAPSREICTVRRIATNTPLQALV